MSSRAMERPRNADRSSMPPSRLGGAPAIVPSDERRLGQLSLPMNGGPTRRRSEPLAGAVHVPAWLDLEAQRELVRQFARGRHPPRGSDSRACRADI